MRSFILMLMCERRICQKTGNCTRTIFVVLYDFLRRHRWTGRYEAHLWKTGSWNPTQRKKGKQGLMTKKNLQQKHISWQHSSSGETSTLQIFLCRIMRMKLIC